MHLFRRRVPQPSILTVLLGCDDSFNKLIADPVGGPPTSDEHLNEGLDKWLIALDGIVTIPNGGMNGVEMIRSTGLSDWRATVGVTAPVQRENYLLPGYLNGVPGVETPSASPSPPVTSNRVTRWSPGSR